MQFPEEPQEDLDYLAQQIAKYPKRSLSTLFDLMSKEFQEHAKKDRRRGRSMRSLALKAAGEYLATSNLYLVTSPSSETSTFLGTQNTGEESAEIRLSELRFRAYELSRFRYGELAHFFSEMATSLEGQRQYVMSGYLKEVQSRLCVAERLSPEESHPLQEI